MKSTRMRPTFTEPNVVRPIRFADPADLTDPATLAAIVGTVTLIERAPLSTLGYTYTGNTLERLDVRLASGETRRLVLKRTWPGRDWLSRCSDDTLGREAALLSEPALAGIWEVFGCPFLAYAARDGEVALLMEDLTTSLFPDVGQPIAEAEEEALLASLAELHARFWGAEVLRLPWLTTPAAHLEILGPTAADREARQPTPDPFFNAVARGWAAAFARLPETVARLLRQPAAALASECDGLPWTLRHGDAKVANFALKHGRVVAFDWALVGGGPATLDLGWYLAVNASRLARSREDVIAHYRRSLESELGRPIAPKVWERLVWVGVLCGALMLLWAKALELESGSQEAAEEWSWWVSALARGA